MERQGIENKRGEVQFRRRLFEQQVEGRPVFEDEFDAAGIEAILRERMEATLRDIRALRAQGVTVSPYVEIGAERGQRALALESELGCRGAAVDLSLDLLRSCAHYAARFGAGEVPLRICADAYRLPFASGSIPFVFCYQTLHHFPDPAPIVEEIHRVLAPGGHFFFAEEPYGRLLHLDLYQVKGGRAASRRRGTLRKVVDRLFAKEVTNEEEFGVIENQDMPIRKWRRSLAPLEEVRLTLDSIGVTAEADWARNPVRRLFATLAGGLMSGLYRKPGRAGELPATIEAALVSPGHPGDAKEAPLVRRPSAFECPASGEIFPIVEGVAVLLPPETRRELYPEITPGETP